MKCYIKMLCNKPLREVDERFFIDIISSSAKCNDVHLFVVDRIIYYLILSDYEYQLLGALSEEPLNDKQLFFECSQVF